MEDQTDRSGTDEITERIGMDNQTCFNNLHDILERLKVVASVEQTLFEDILGKKVLPAPTAEITPSGEK